ncbi:hypothetical protein BKA83DRAFT_4199173 [Pisolithus microcarpus]|nr:hypothetical protein BKA83DRAFT_4199173 [Pisolithus microcarpus]
MPMLVLQSLHNYLAQVLSPPSIHTALLVTPEGALVSYASQLDCENDQGSTHAVNYNNKGELGRVRSKDEVRKVAGLSAEVWAETRGVDGEEGMVESELGRILVVAVEEPREENSGSAEDPLLLLALNGTTDADWDRMSKKARRLAAFLAPSVSKQRGQMQPVSPVSLANGAPKSRTRSAGDEVRPEVCSAKACILASFETDRKLWVFCRWRM